MPTSGLLFRGFSLAALLLIFAPCMPARLRAQSVEPTLPRRIQFGATLAEVPDSSLKHGAPKGAGVVSVVGGSSAAAAGVRAGDIIISIDRDSVRSVPDALAALKPIAAGHAVAVALVRDGRVVSAEFVARERPRETSAEFTIEYRAVSARGGTHRVLLTHPNDGRAHPAVLIIGGIGCYSVDAPAGPMAYRDLAYHLTRRGYATVRVEKLGIADSEGGPCLDTDFEAELDGYRQALLAMKSFPSVDSTAIVIFGHSIGGIEAPLLAAEISAAPSVRGVAVLSTTGIAWYEYELANLRRQLGLQDLAPDSVERAMHFKTTCAYSLLIAKERREQIVTREPLCARYLAYPASDEYMQRVADESPAKVWKGVTVPALIMHGASDFVTSREEHVELTADINRVHPGLAAYFDIADIDHYMAHEISERASLHDPVPGLTRPYYGATLEPVIDRWLDSVAFRGHSASGR